MPRRFAVLPISIPTRISGTLLLLCPLVLLLVTGCKQSAPPPSETAAASPVAAPSTSAAVPATPSPVPFIKKHLYSETANPKADIAAAVARAGKEHKRIILDFGGDWCGDCQVLDIYFHQPPNDRLAEDHFITVHVDIGQMDHNVDIAEKYQVPIKKGVPALAVLDSRGKLLFSQQNKEFERNVTVDAVTEFLNHWKA